MAALAVGVTGIFLTPFLQGAVDRISKSRAFIKYLDIIKGKKGIKDEEALMKLELTLYKISGVLEDAEVKEGRGAETVRRWLGKVRAEVNHADDLLDEFNTECSRLQLLRDDLIYQSKADLKVHRCCIPFRKQIKTPAYELPLFIEELMPNLETVIERLEVFVNQISELGLQQSSHKEKYPYSAPSSSVVDKLKIFGRDDEKKELIERVLSDGGASDVSVIAITGMGGIGKTTLAQLVYNDDRVKEKFRTRAWVCVSEEYDLLRVTKTLLMEVNSAVVDDKDDFNRLQVKLEDNLKGKCFLFILDDIWNEKLNDWSSLKNPLNGSRGSKIIVTTRNEKVARMMQTEPFHSMQKMPENQSWCLFKSYAFDNGDHTPLHEFETVGKEIVKQCEGLPLAIKAVAGALRPKIGINEWRNFLSSEVWAVGGDILPALSLSYKHLPSHLKCCFAFCALFPKDVPFDKDEVVLLWMANDLVKPSTSTLNDGREYFEELKSRSFFESANEKKYVMHDLINDLARSVTGNACIRLEDYQVAHRHESIQREKEPPPELLHFSYLINSSSESSQNFIGLSQVQGLRTFLPIHPDQYSGLRYTSTFSFSDMFQRLKRLRALSLSQYCISMVPDSIGDLKHLRFLNLASTNIEKLPNAISKCLNLQTLILANCNKLVELPGDMKLLINLQHLDLRSVGELFIRKMATWLNIFKDIQNISVVVDKIQGSDLELLVQLQLRHSLNIIGLGDTNVATIERAKWAGLNDIENLSLEWSGSAEYPEDELKKFAKLQLHANTKQLSIKGYKGTRFPDWLGDSAFTNMESLTLEDCENCSSLPPLGQLSALKTLKISYMDGISEIGKKLYGDASTSKPFQALQELGIFHCNNILCFPEGGLAAPNLKKLEIKFCEKMKSLPARMHTQLPLLSYLSIRDCPEIECFPEGGLPSSLETLWIWNCKNMRNCQTNWGLQRLPSLTYIYLNGFDDTLFPEEGFLHSSLQSLWVMEFNNLESLNEKVLQHLSSLKSLRIDRCRNLKYLPQQKFSSSLSKMTIVGCEQIESFPEGLASSLSQLHIWKCPKLEERIEREKGKDWPKVSHIPKICFNGHEI